MIVASLAVGLAMFATSTASAQYLSRVNFSGKFSYEIDTYNSPVWTYKVKNYAFNNKTLIAFFNNSPYMPATIPAGSFFVADQSGNVIATNKSGFSLNLSASYYSSAYGGYFTPLYINTGSGNTVTRGKYNNNTLQENENSMTTDASINIDDGWYDYITINGLAKNRTTASKYNSNTFMQNQSMKASITGSGDGTIYTPKDGWEDGIVQGKGSASGHGKVPLL